MKSYNKCERVMDAPCNTEPGAQIEFLNLAGRTLSVLRYELRKITFLNLMDVFST